jgi:hypothetical protein
MGNLSFFVVLAIGETVTGGGLTRFFLISDTKSPPEEFSRITMGGSENS